MTKPNIGIEMRSIGDLRPQVNNARTHSAEQVDQIAASIVEFGFNVPILLDEDNRIVAGHGRFLAAKSLGLDDVPTIRLTHLSPVQLRAYMIADNKLAMNAGWDNELLATELAELGALDFDVPVLGFTEAELDVILSAADEASPDTSEGTENEIPPMPTSPITRPGDVWHLGRHRLICGDAREPSVLRRLLGQDVADLIFTDPPYNVPIDGHVCGSGRIRHREFSMGVGEMSSDQFTDFLTSSLAPGAACCRDGAVAFVCMDWRHMGELLAAGKKVFSELKNVCVWNKKNGGMGTFYRSKHEMVFVFKVGTVPHTNNFGLGDKGRYRSNVWDYAGITSGGADRLKELAMHPTVKPIALIEDALRDCSNRGSIVLDVFGGSGSTLIAAQKCGRSARLVEIDPHYCDVTVKRFGEFTGKIPKRVRRLKAAL